MTEDKNSNLMIIGLGIVTVFFAYLIYMKSKDIQTPTPSIQPIPIYQPIQQAPQAPQSSQLIDNIQLYNIQLQTQQINDTLRLQMNQIQSIQEQQLKQSESIIKLENAKCSNVVSMNSNNDYNTTNDNIYNQLNNINPIKNIQLSNTTRENEELIANRMFGMK